MQKLLDEAEAAIAKAASAAMEAERAAADVSIAKEEAEQRRRWSCQTAALNVQAAYVLHIHAGLTMHILVIANHDLNLKSCSQQKPDLNPDANPGPTTHPSPALSHIPKCSAVMCHQDG